MKPAGYQSHPNIPAVEVGKDESGLLGKLGRNRKSRPFPDATKMLAIVAERCYQKTCKLTNNQTLTARTIFKLFVGQNLIKYVLLAFNWLYWPKLAGKQRMLFGKGNTKLIAGKSGCDWYLADSTLCLQPLQQISRTWIHCGSRGCASCQYLVACLVFEQNGKSGSQTFTWSSDWTE